MPVTIRTIVERSDGSRVTELLSGTPLDALEQGEAGELDGLLMGWMTRHAAARPGTQAIAVSAAMRAIQREPADSILRVRRAAVTDSRLPRRLPPSLRS